MLSRFIQSSTLSLFISGCALPPGPSPVQAGKARSGDPDAEVTFDESSRAYEAYQMLRRKSVPLRQLDRGCHAIDFTMGQPNESQTFKGDGRIQECEVVEFVLDHYQNYPEIAMSLIGGPIPWTFEETGEGTAFGQKIRMQVSHAIEALKNQLQRQGLDPRSDAYQESLAIGLYYFARYPRQGAKIDPVIQKIISKDMERLRYGGLDEYRKWIIANGGLGLSQFERIDQKELSALEALQQAKGECTEQSKVLYALFQMAGLSPVFIYGRFKDLEAKLTRYNKVIPFKSRVQDHIYVGIQFETHMRFIDSAVSLTTIDDDTYYPLSLIHYLAADKNNMAIAAGFRGDRQLRHELYEQAMWLSPDFPLARLRRVSVWFEAGENEKALHEVDRLITDYPDDARFLHLKADILFEQQRFVEAKAFLHRALAADPFLPMTNFTLGKLYAAYHDYKKAEKYLWTAVTLDPNLTGAYYFLGLTLYHLGKDRMAREIFEALVKGAPKSGYALHAKAYSVMLLARNGRVGEAKARLASATAEERNSVVMTYTAGILYLIADDPALAEQYFRKALRRQHMVSPALGLVISLRTRGLVHEADKLLREISMNQYIWSSFREFENLMPTHPEIPKIRRKLEKYTGKKKTTP